MMHHIKSDAFPRVAYQKYGTGPVVVLLHGFPADGTLWDKIYPGLSSFTTIIPDFPGTGDSAGMDEELTIEKLADFVHVILKHEQITSAVLAGHSMGGYVAVAFAGKYPAILKGMAMIHSSAGGDDEEKKEMRKKVIAIIRNGGREAFIKQMVTNLFSPGFQSVHLDEIEQQTEKSLKISPEALISFYTAMMNRPSNVQVLENAVFPIQWIFGQDDTILPLNRNIKQSSIANINSVNLYKKCGHMSMMEKPAQLTTDLKRFLEYCFRSIN